MRARYPDLEGYVERDGVKTFYEVFGTGETTLLLLPAWSTTRVKIVEPLVANWASPS